MRRKREISNFERVFLDRDSLNFLTENFRKNWIYTFDVYTLMLGEIEQFLLNCNGFAIFCYRLM